MKLDSPGTVKVRAQVAAYLDPEHSPTGADIQWRPLTVQPYWDIERARIGKSRNIPVEVIVNGRSVAKKEVVADWVVPGRRI